MAPGSGRSARDDNPLGSGSANERKLRVVVGGEFQAHPQADLEGSAAGVTYLDVHAPYNFGAGYALVESSPVSWFRFSAGTRVDVYSNFGAIVVPRLALIFKPASGAPSRSWAAEPSARPASTSVFTPTA